MVYEVPKSKASLKQNKFEFKFPGNAKVYSVPLLTFIKPALALRLGQMSEIQIAAEIFSVYLPDATDQFEDATQLEDFMEAWKKASGIDLGESEASASS